MQKIKDAESSILSLYFKDLIGYHPLNRQKEIELVKKIQKGNKKAECELIKSNLRFVVSVARNYANQGMTLNDLISIGNIGLMRAVKKFRVDRNTKFISYAVWWIRQAILEALSRQSRSTKIPLNLMGSLYKIKKIQEKLEQKYKRYPSAEEIASEMKTDIKRINEILNIETSFLSLDCPLSYNSDDTFLDRIHTDENEDESMKEIDRFFMKNLLDKSFEILSEREKKVLKRLFGFDKGCTATLDEVGKEMKLTRERIRQIRANALERLRKSDKLKSLVLYN